MKITFEKGEKCNQIKFYVSLKLLIEVKNKNIIEYWLGLLYEAELNHGLKNLNLLKCEEYVKKQVISQMKQNIILIKKADKYDCKLTHSEKQQCSDSALSYYQDKTGKKVMKECGATREDVEKI